MDWANEKYVRLFTRDTPEWLVLPWQAKALWPLMVRKFDRSGVLATKLGARGVAVLVGLPLEVVEPGLTALLEDGCLELHELGYLSPNYLEAQETPQSDANRQRESRERRRQRKPLNPGSSDVATTTECHAVSRGVTRCHAVSQPVTPDQTSPDQTRESSPARAIPPSPVQPPYPEANGMGPNGERAPYNPDDPRSRGLLAEQTYRRVSDARVELASRLGLPDQLPFPPVTPSSRPRAFSDLLDRVREEGINAPAACDRVVASLLEQAEADRSVEWLSQKAFGSGPWSTARERIPGASRERAPPANRGRSQPERTNPMKPWT